MKEFDPRPQNSERQRNFILKQKKNFEQERQKRLKLIQKPTQNIGKE
jgi:hypothetical protein